VVKYNEEAVQAGIPKDKVAPMLLPDYTEAGTREKQLTSHYVGTMR